MSARLPNRVSHRSFAPTAAALPSKPLLTTGEAARALSVSAQTVRNWAASGRLAGVMRGARTMIPREIVVAEIERSWIAPRDARTTGPRPRDVYGWMARANAEGIRFPLDAYNARIPRDLLDNVARRGTTEAALSAPWSEHFHPATEYEVLALLTGAE